MWIIPNGASRVSAGATIIPPELARSLTDWYQGTGTQADHRAALLLVERIQAGHHWIACDCRGGQGEPPLLAAALLTQSETYYLRRLNGPKRTEHLASCPYFREQQSVTSLNGSGEERARVKPDGYFAVLKPAAQRLAQMPIIDAAPERRVSAPVPRLARLLWTLLDVSGRGQLGSVGETGLVRTIRREFEAIRIAASAIEIARGITLHDLLWTHIDPFHAHRVFAALRARRRTWPKGSQPQAFLLLYTQDVTGHVLHLPGAKELRVATRVDVGAVSGSKVPGPYLTLVVVGELNPRHGYEALRAYAQPIVAGNLFMSVDSGLERDAAKALLALRLKFANQDMSMRITKPLFDIITPDGPVRPAFIIDTQGETTGVLDSFVLEVTDFASGDHHSAGARAHRVMANIAQVETIDAQGLACGDLEAIILRRAGQHVSP